MKLKFQTLALSAACSALLFAGCAGQTDKKAAVDRLFKGIQHLTEAQSMEVQGSVATSEWQTPFVLSYETKPQLSMELTGQLGDAPYSFYIRDEKTYLDFNGTKSQSLLKNLTGEDGDNLDGLINPFLDLNSSQRMDLFESVTLEDDVYTYSFNKKGLSKLIDAYQTFEPSKARLEVEFDQEEIKSFALNIEGHVAMDSLSAEITLKIDADIDSLNQPVDIEYPEGMENWNS